jgi:hypothetical protein
MEQKTGLRICYESLSAGSRKGLNSPLATASGTENTYLPSMFICLCSGGDLSAHRPPSPGILKKLSNPCQSLLLFVRYDKEKSVHNIVISLYGGDNYEEAKSKHL